MLKEPLCVTDRERIVTSELVVLAAAAFAVLGCVPARLDLRRHAVVVTADGAVLVVGLFVLAPLAVLVAAIAGVATAQLLHRAPLRKVLVAVVLRCAAVVIAVAGFAVVGGSGRRDAWALTGTVAVVVVVALLEHLAHTALVVASEHARLAPVIIHTWPAALLLHLGTVPIGAAGLVLADRNPFLALLLVPVVVAVVASGRAVADRQAERLRVERLLRASARTAELRGFVAALTVSAEQARSLTTATAGICCAPDCEGRWTGVAVDDDGARDLDPGAIAALRDLATDGAVELDLHQEMLSTRLALPPARTLVIATAAPDAATELILGGFRERPAAPGGRTTVGTLEAFVPLAALAVANARLYEEVDAAYRRELDLNRQKGEFVATVSHELRTPVAAMMGTIETVSRLAGRIDDRRRAALLTGAIEHGGRLTRLIEELLLVAATEQSASTLHVDDVAVDAVLAKAVAATATVADGRVVSLVSREVDRLRTDEHKLLRILVNLIENAAKYAPDGPIELEAIAGGTNVLFFVTDHGPGISSTDRGRVFERFVQLDQSLTRRRGGLGLGLHLCRQLAGLLGGDLVLTETPGGGCCFCLAVRRELVGSVGGADTAPPATGLLRRPVERCAS